MIGFVWPWLLALAPLPLLVRWLMPPADSVGGALQVPDPAAFGGATSNTLGGAPRRLLPLVVLWLTWLLLLCAAARPQWTGEPVETGVTGRDLMIAVDISGSMKTEDMTLGNRTATRLQVVKAVLADFVERRAGDRIGLILFGSNAYVQAPLTFDRHTVMRLLTEAPIGIAGGKTAIGDAIGLAVKRLRERPATNRVLILLTDGSNNMGEVEPRRAAELAAAEGVRIHTIGVGADEMRLPGFFGLGRLVNPASDLDEDTLRAIADATGGRYFRARDTGSLVEIYAEIDAMEPVDQEAETVRPVRSLFHWPLGAALLLSLWLAAQRLPAPMASAVRANKAREQAV